MSIPRSSQAMKQFLSKVYKFCLSIVTVFAQLVFNITGKEALNNSDTLSIQPIFQYGFGKHFAISVRNTDDSSLGAKVITRPTYVG